MNVGAEMGVAPGDIVGAILGETGLPAKVVGTVDVRERHVFIDVASEHANSIISKCFCCLELWDQGSVARAHRHRRRTIDATIRRSGRSLGRRRRRTAHGR